VWRAHNPVLDSAAKEVWPLSKSGGAAIVVDASDATLHAIVARDADLTPDPERHYLLVEATSHGGAAPVHCERPLPVWQPRQRKPRPSGLHGPYRSADAAVLSTGVLAMELTAGNEAAFLVLHDARGPRAVYYTTPPVVATPPDGAPDGATVTNGDYASSLRNAFVDSCEELASFAIASWAHTHPTHYYGLDWANDNFSMMDFNFAVSNRLAPGFRFGPDLQIRSAPVGIYTDLDASAPAAGNSLVYVVVPNDKCIRGFTPREGDSEFTKEEMGKRERVHGRLNLRLARRGCGGRAAELQ
jgi:hypothetical protein